MNVVVMCCTLNEERNIERYCEVYSRFANRILICDGGSTDATIELAEGFPKVEVIKFARLMDFGGYPWNPLGELHNFAYKAAKKFNPDWIITDECDSIPTRELQEAIRWKMYKSTSDTIGVGRMYITGVDYYFPNLSLMGYFAWAHRPNKIDGSYWEGNHFALRREPVPPADSGHWQALAQPFALLHYGWPNKGVVAYKTMQKRASGSLPEKGTPIPEGAGKPMPLPEWARWN